MVKIKLEEKNQVVSYNDMLDTLERHGKSKYFHVDYKRGYRVCVIEYNDMYYVTQALRHPSGTKLESITIEPLKSLHDALICAKFMRQLYDARNSISK